MTTTDWLKGDMCGDCARRRGIREMPKVGWSESRCFSCYGFKYVVPPSTWKVFIPVGRKHGKNSP